MTPVIEKLFFALLQFLFLGSQPNKRDCVLVELSKKAPIKGMLVKPVLRSFSFLSFFLSFLPMIRQRESEAVNKSRFLIFILAGQSLKRTEGL